MKPPIPVTIVTGFLGAGKSTLLDRWLGELPSEETVVIINERGEVGIDGELLARRQARIREITGGCVCCTTVLALDATLTEFSEMQPPPRRILVETSGAASPAGVIRALTRGTARQRLRLDGVVTAVDATRAETIAQYTLAIEQLGFADIVVMTHSDACATETLAAVEHMLHEFAPGAVVTRSTKECVDGGQTLLDLLAARGQALHVAAPDEASSTDRHGIEAVGFVHDGKLDEARFSDWVEEALGGVEARILRVKGILAIAGVDERVVVQGVGEAIEVSLGVAWGQSEPKSRMVVLGLGLDEDALQRGFAGCVL